MSADDQTFLDVLNAVGSDVKKYSGDYLELLERGVDKAASVVRDTLSQPWVPEAVRPKSPPKPPVSSKIVPIGLYTRVNRWVLDNKLLTGTFVVGITATTFGLLYRSKRNYSRKRRAKRASNGARLEVVLLAGSPSEPIVRSLALDLERRGFIVFIICNDVEEEVAVQAESRADIRPLTVDIERPDVAIGRFQNYLQTPQHAFDGARPHHLTFSSLILIPSLTYPSAPLATLSPSAVSDILSTRLIHPILLTQAFLPLLTELPFPHPHHHPAPPSPNPKVVVLTPSIIPSLNPAFHIPESTTCAALTAFVQSLSSELAPLSIPVTHLKLGTFDISSLQSKAQAHGQSFKANSAETLRWASGAKEVYGKNYLRMMERGSGKKNGGSPLRELHNAVFDVIETKEPTWMSTAFGGYNSGRVIRVGQGSGTYAFVGTWIPRGLVGWMMGMRRVERTEVIEREEEEEDLSRSLTKSDGDFVSIGMRSFDSSRHAEAEYHSTDA